MAGNSYIGRFAPSPTGPLHAGSLVAALASWLDARAHGGQWLVRIEDVDTTRCLPGMELVILQQLAACGLHSDLPPIYQSQRTNLYQQTLELLIASAHVYPCGCSRKDIETTLQRSGQCKPRHGELIYPGTCRDGLHGKTARGWRFRLQKDIQNHPLELMHQAQTAIDSGVVSYLDRSLGEQSQDVATEVGDFILKRADGCFAYQLAVVVDDAAQGITDVVRGQDLADNTARQILLQRALNMATPRYLHTPLVLGANGEKLSKQNGAQALDTQKPLDALNSAATTLGLSESLSDMPAALATWVIQWRDNADLR
jgi:glutamyl-Q tRNA(Asp) synthetase